MINFGWKEKEIRVLSENWGVLGLQHELSKNKKNRLEDTTAAVIRWRGGSFQKNSEQKQRNRNMKEELQQQQGKKWLRGGWNGLTAAEERRTMMKSLLSVLNGDWTVRMLVFAGEDKKGENLAILRKRIL